MTRFRDGDASAFDELLDRHRRPLFAYLLRSVRNPQEAEDLFQELFIKVIRAAPRWQAKAKVTTWLYTIARNTAIDGARRRGAQPAVTPIIESGEAVRGVVSDTLGDSRLAADEQLLERERVEAIEELLAGLPDEQREVFLLKRDGLTFDQIAEVVEISRNTAKSRLRYALAKLRTGLVERGLLDDTPPRSTSPRAAGRTQR